MKIFFALLLLASMLNAPAAPHYHRRFRCPHRPVSVVRHVPWQPILAGGTAAGVVIASYKISDGVESGLKTAARSNPEAFLQTIHPLALPIKVLLAGGALYFLYFLIKKGRKNGNQCIQK